MSIKQSRWVGVGVSVLTVSTLLAVVACSDDPGATGTSGPTVSASTAAATVAVTGAGTTAVGSEREYPDGVRAVAERPSGEPIPAMLFADGGPEPIPGFGTIVLASASDPPQLSELWIRWGPDNKTESYVFVTAGDRFAIDGFVFEIVAIDSTFAQVDAWSPEQLAAASTTSTASDREYPDGVTAVAERPEGVPESVLSLVGTPPAGVGDLGDVRVEEGHRPPTLSSVVMRILADEGSESLFDGVVRVYVTVGDRFEVRGYVLEVMRIDESSGEFDVWKPNPLVGSEHPPDGFPKYPDGFVPIADRPDTEPEERVEIANRTGENVADLGDVSINDAYDPPYLSEVYFPYLGESVFVTEGDRFGFEGRALESLGNHVFEVVSADPYAVVFDVWTPDQLADS